MRRTLAGFLIVLFSAASAEAIGPVSLKEALELGLERNHALKAAEAATGAAREGVGAARGHLLPKVAFEERYMRTNNPTYAFSSKLNQERFSSADFAVSSLNGPDAIDDFQTSFSIEQPLFVKKALVGFDMAKTEYAASRDELGHARGRTAFDIASAYLSVNTAEGFVRAAEASVADAREHLRIAEARNTEGLGLHSDVLRARTGLLEAEQRLVTAGKGLTLAKRALGLQLGVDEEVAASSNGPVLELRALEHYLSASRERKDLKSVEKRAENARAGVSLADSEYFPSIGVGGAYFMNDHDGPFGSEGESWLVSASLKWTLFDSTRSHEAARARLKSIEARERLSGLRQFVSFSVHKAYLDAQEARKNAELSETALKSAEESERLVRLRYENSLSPLVDLLDAQAALAGARAAAVMKKNESAAAMLSLSSESGTILNDLGLE